MNEFKKLMGDAISEDTAVALQTILETHLQEAANTAQSKLDVALQEEQSKSAVALQEAETKLQESEDKIASLSKELVESQDKQADLLDEQDKTIATLKEKADEYAAQVKQEALDEANAKFATEKLTLVEHAEAYAEKVKQEALDEAAVQFEAEKTVLIEQADEYAEKVKQEATQELSEKADAYGAFLQEKAEEYAEKVKQESREENIAEMTEKADAYGDYLQEQAEAYGALLIEQAEVYATEQVKLTESRCLAESEKMIAEFKESHLEAFERLDEHNRMSTVFKNLKQLIESSGFSIEESDSITTLEDELRESRKEKRALERSLREQAAELKELQVKSLVESMAEDLAFTEKERIVKATLRTRSESQEELSEVIKTLIENTTLNKNITNTNALNENVEVPAGAKTKSGWGDQLK